MTRACLKIHFRHLHTPLCGIFDPNSVNVARYASLIRAKSPTNWSAHLTKSNFQTHSRENRQLAKDWAKAYPLEEQKEYEKDQDYLECVKDILDNPIFQSMDDFIQHGDTTCKDHCIQVSYLSYCICKKRGWDYRQAARAALLHDLFLYDWHFHAKETGNHFHGLTHPRTAMDNASRYFELTSMEKNIILRHMWPLTPVPPRYKEGFVIVYADKHCGLMEVLAHTKVWAAHVLVAKKFARYQ